MNPEPTAALAISDRSDIPNIGRVVIHDTAERLLADEHMEPISISVSIEDNPFMTSASTVPPPGGDTVFRDARVLDVLAGRYLDGQSVWVECVMIHTVAPDADRMAGADAEVIDLGGKMLMPGLYDAHVHVTAITPNFAALGRMSPFYVTVHTADGAGVRLHNRARCRWCRLGGSPRRSRKARCPVRGCSIAARRSRRPVVIPTYAGPAVGTGRVLLLCGARPGL